MLVKCRLEPTLPNDTVTPASQWRPLRAGERPRSHFPSTVPISIKYILVCFRKNNDWLITDVSAAASGAYEDFC